ncbi:MAG: hypothetical protein CVV44_05370 [Spirochaetae bacterium HGW-Spirochaetae-1]|jgi:hypothetical protein|nr:MAG: hypothetical protein CVV44_05370 [Spirochaetae bacterium HGW-Spirochaetae-1]
MFRVKRKAHRTEFSSRDTTGAAFLLASLFLMGLYLSWKGGPYHAALYILLWVLSYIVIYAGTCRHCAYYGKNCPVPLEGQCVHYFFKSSGKPFTFMALFWASVSYLLRVIVPAYILVVHAMVFFGAVYLGIFILYWFLHLRITGCSKCVNTGCPLNPDYNK